MQNKKGDVCQFYNAARAALTAFFFIFAYMLIQRHSSHSASVKKESKSCYPEKGVRGLNHRDEIGALLEEHGLKSGVEVGVQQGVFSRIILSQWKSCRSYKLVDIWEHQHNYKDGANVDQETHNKFFEDTKATLKEYDQITEYYRMYSVEAAKRIEKESLDFAFIDARHDYCGVKEDLEAYWPLVKPGAIMAGHDYVTAEEVGIEYILSSVFIISFFP